MDPKVGTEVSISVIGTGGPIEIVIAESASVNFSPKLDSKDCLDGYEYTREVGPRATGTIKRPHFNGAMIDAAKAQMTPGSNIKYQVVMVIAGKTVTFVNCHITGLSLDIPDGILGESLDFKAQKVM